MSSDRDITCQELTEVLTDYLEGAMPFEDQVRFEAHLAICEGCVTYVTQMRQTIETMRELHPAARGGDRPRGRARGLPGVEARRAGARDVSATAPLAPGDPFPDLELPDHAGNVRRLSELVAGDPTVLHCYRGWWCPKEQRYFRRLLELQDEAEVAYVRIVSLSVDPPEVTAAFRAGLGARWTFLCDPERRALAQLGPARDDRHQAQPVRPARLHAVARGPAHPRRL